MKYLFVLFLLILHFKGSSQNAEYKKLTDEGLELLEKNLPDEAIKKYNKALLLDSTRVEPYYGLGVAYYLLCRKTNQPYKKPLNCFDKAIYIDGSYRKAYYYRASCNALLGNFQNAVRDFDKAIQKEPENGYYYYNRAFAKLNLGDEKGCCLDLNESCGLKYNESCQKIKEQCH